MPCLSTCAKKIHGNQKGGGLMRRSNVQFSPRLICPEFSYHLYFKSRIALSDVVIPRYYQPSHLFLPNFITPTLTFFLSFFYHPYYLIQSFIPDIERNDITFHLIIDLTHSDNNLPSTRSNSFFILPIVGPIIF